MEAHESAGGVGRGVAVSESGREHSEIVQRLGIYRPPHLVEQQAACLLGLVLLEQRERMRVLAPGRASAVAADPDAGPARRILRREAVRHRDLSAREVQVLYDDVPAVEARARAGDHGEAVVQQLVVAPGDGLLADAAQAERLGEAL